MHKYLCMEPNEEKIDKNERIHVRPDADEKKQVVREAAEARGENPAPAAAQGEEEVAEEFAEGEVSADEVGEKMAEQYMRGALSGEKTVDPLERPDTENVITSAPEEYAPDDEKVPEESEPAARPAPMRQPD